MVGPFSRVDDGEAAQKAVLASDKWAGCPLDGSTIVFFVLSRLGESVCGGVTPGRVVVFFT